MAPIIHRHSALPIASAVITIKIKLPPVECTDKELTTMHDCLQLAWWLPKKIKLTSMQSAIHDCCSVIGSYSLGMKAQGSKKKAARL